MDNMNCIKIYAASCGYYARWGNSVKCLDSSPAGGVGCYIGFENKSKKTIQRVTFVVEAYNASNEKVACDKTGESEKCINYTRKLGPGCCSGEIAWEDVWYNTEVKKYAIKSAEVEFIDGSIVKLDNTMLGKNSSGSLGNSGRAMRAFTICFGLICLIGLIFLLVRCSDPSYGSSYSHQNQNNYDRHYSDDEITTFVNNYDGKW